MMLSRRATLGLIGGGTILAASAAIGGFAATRSPKKALLPWDVAGNYAEPRRRALSYALLAPNPHNRQPWLVDLSQKNVVVVHLDKQRVLPETDPFARQLTIGMGCFLELMVMAAAETGHGVDLDLFPKGDDGPVAVARFEAGAEPDPLFAHVMDRRSCKEPFELRPLPAAMIETLTSLAEVITESNRVDDLRDLTWEAYKIEVLTPHTLKESVDLMRLGKAEIEANPDGIDLGGAFLETLMLAGILTRESLLNPESSGFQEGMRIYQEMLAATPAYAVITSNGNTREDQIVAGRQWLRLNLTTTSLGLALHPVSQALQEYPEMQAQYERAHEILAKPGETVQMLGRLGYGPPVSASPRWPLEDRIIDG